MRAKLYVGNRNYSSWSIRGSLLVRQSGLDCEEKWPELMRLAAEAAAEPWSLGLEV